MLGVVLSEWQCQLRSEVGDRHGDDFHTICRGQKKEKKKNKKQPQTIPTAPELNQPVYSFNIQASARCSLTRPLLETRSISLLLVESELQNFTSPPHDSDIGAKNAGLWARLSHEATTQCKQTPSARVNSNHGQSTALSWARPDHPADTQVPSWKTTHGSTKTQFSNPPRRNGFYIAQFLSSDLASLRVLQRIRSQHGRREGLLTTPGLLPST